MAGRTRRRAFYPTPCARSGGGHSRISEERAKKLLADLGSDKEETWKAAYEELSYLDLRLSMNLFDVLKDVKEQEHQERFVALLRGFPLSKADALRWCKIDFEPKRVPQIQGQPAALFVVITNHPNKPAEFKTALDLLKANVPVMTYALASDPKTLSDVVIAPLSWRRAVRAIALLEHLGTPDAMKVLEAMATGHADAGPTIAAKASLERLKK